MPEENKQNIESLGKKIENLKTNIKSVNEILAKEISEGEKVKNLQEERETVRRIKRTVQELSKAGCLKKDSVDADAREIKVSKVPTKVEKTLVEKMISRTSGGIGAGNGSGTGTKATEMVYSKVLIAICAIVIVICSFGSWIAVDYGFGSQEVASFWKIFKSGTSGGSEETKIIILGLPTLAVGIVYVVLLIRLFQQNTTDAVSVGLCTTILVFVIAFAMKTTWMKQGDLEDLEDLGVKVVLTWRAWVALGLSVLSAIIAQNEKKIDEMAEKSAGQNMGKSLNEEKQQHVENDLKYEERNTEVQSNEKQNSMAFQATASTRAFAGSGGSNEVLKKTEGIVKRIPIISFRPWEELKILSVLLEKGEESTLTLEYICEPNGMDKILNRDFGQEIKLILDVVISFGWEICVIRNAEFIIPKLEKEGKTERVLLEGMESLPLEHILSVKVYAKAFSVAGVPRNMFTGIHAELVQTSSELAEYRASANSKALCIPKTIGSGWLCSGGMYHDENEEKCTKCGIIKAGM